MNNNYLKPRQALNKWIIPFKQLVYEGYGLTEKEIRIVEGGEG
ncbi:hypothetical protein [Cecembia lonarensis]|uniref:Uncharacterized protein n=1 Tax=Cecembia lonarensis (strain CCUG 58316 / KCTC 22772 / LW9) TaxID=1225176 RepID=K1LA89_CECL9|nr:hypothetical protein [Cecembia lonarensis]EKB47283.1 hypothetical protein B879_04119 [Cecembia lonarensis LW9]